MGALEIAVCHETGWSFCCNDGCFPVDMNSLGCHGNFEPKVNAPRSFSKAVPLPTDVERELATYLVSRGLDAGPEDIGSQRAFLVGKASDAASRACCDDRGGEANQTD